jgi:hypothetical protein
MAICARCSPIAEVYKLYWRAFSAMFESHPAAMTRLVSMKRGGFMTKTREQDERPSSSPATSSSSPSPSCSAALRSLTSAELHLRQR